jgi:hypothetical protein
MTEEINYQTIKFSHNEAGELPLSSSKTGFDGLLAIGALMYTSKLVFEEGGAYKKFATDEEGLKRADYLTGEALGIIEDINATLGYLMAYVDQEEVSDAIYKVGWILVALSELSREVRCAQNEFQHSRRCMKSE